MMYENWYISNWDDVKTALSKLPFLPPSEKRTKVFDYVTKLINNVNQVVRFDDFFEGLDQDIFNHIKITDGMVGILKDEYGFQCTTVRPVGLPRKDGRPYKVIAQYIRVPANGIPEIIVKDNLINDEDIVIFYNTAYAQPDFNLFWLAKMLGETDLSIYKNIIYSRYAPLLRGKSEKEKIQLEKSIAKVVEGELSIFIPEDMIESELEGNNDLVVNITDVANSDKIQYLSHLYQDFIKRFSMDYGCPISGVEKMAQQNNAEINGDVAYSWLVPIDMLNQAKEGINRAKKLWPELTIEAHFGTLHELMYLKFAQDITKDNPDMNVSIEENQNLEDLSVDEMFSGTDEEESAKNENQDFSEEESEEVTEEETTEEEPEEPEEESEEEEDKKNED